MDMPELPKNKTLLIGGGVGAAALVGLWIYKSRKGSAQSSGDSDLMTSPYGAALMYMPGGAGGGSYQGLSTGVSLPTPVTPTDSGPSMWDSILAQVDLAKLQSLAARDVADINTLSQMGIGPGNTGTITHTGSGSTIRIQPNPQDPATVSSADIRAYIGRQESAGVPITPATVNQWIKQSGVSAAQIGAAYGYDEATTAKWLAGGGGPSQSQQSGNGNSNGSLAPAVPASNSPGQIWTVPDKITGMLAPYAGKAVTAEHVKGGIAQLSQSLGGRDPTAYELSTWASNAGIPMSVITKAYGATDAQMLDWLKKN